MGGKNTHRSLGVATEKKRDVIGDLSVLVVAFFLQHSAEHLELLDQTLGTCDSVADRQIALVYLVIVATFAGLVSEEMNLVVLLDVTKTVRLVPAYREYVEGYLSACKKISKID